MVMFFVGATASAIGHDVYYSSLHGTVVVNTTSKWDLEAVRDGQEWKIRFGTGFAFLVKAMFAQAVVIAFQQHLWLTTRNKAITINGLDAMFAAAGSLVSFFNGEFLRKAKVGAILALLVWLIPLSALITPATLTVTPSTHSSTRIGLVPSVNFSHIDPLFDSDVGEIESTLSDNGITPYMARLVASTASSLQVLPMDRAIAGSNYNVTFHGPSFRCQEPSALIKEAILITMNATWFIATSPKTDPDFTSKTAWLAFPPPISFLYHLAEAEAEEKPLLDVTRENIFNHGRLWIWAQNVTYDCVLTDTEYNVHFYYSASEGAQRIKPEYNFRWTEDDLYGSYFAIANAIANLLSGVMRGYRTGIMSYKTRMAETAVFSGLKASPGPYEAPSSRLSTLVLPPDIKALARNKSVGELVEELSRNVTLSLFSADKVLSENGTEAMVNTTFAVNVYSYNRRNLLITYAATFVASFIGVLIGCIAYVKNGVSYDSSFSVIMLTTRNQSLDKLAMGHSMGAKPLAEDVQKAELKFGLLLDSDKEGPGGVKLRRVGFGFKNTVLPLQKAAPYY
ncbi:hypothetical protein PT974_02301 [Cladobotryum mycophilum]|uniref:Uncharacterized protein n=1 Tax=Cladobotryum mycophilum TaxID=491253 RepID=A0ABR0SXR8_9HYPO